MIMLSYLSLKTSTADVEQKRLQRWLLKTSSICSCMSVKKTLWCKNVWPCAWFRLHERCQGRDIANRLAGCVTREACNPGHTTPTPAPPATQLQAWPRPGKRLTVWSNYDRTAVETPTSPNLTACCSTTLHRLANTALRHADTDLRLVIAPWLKLRSLHLVDYYASVYMSGSGYPLSAEFLMHPQRRCPLTQTCVGQSLLTASWSCSRAVDSDAWRGPHQKRRKAPSLSSRPEPP